MNDAIEPKVPVWFPAPVDEHNVRLVEHVHPAEWSPPQPAPRYNLVVLGGGTAGLVAAAGAAGLGGRVALIESRLLGGDCLNYGCVPSKAVIRAARAVGELQECARFGLEAGPVSVDFGAVMRRMRRLRAGIAAHDSAARFRDLGVDVFLGRGRFVARDAVEVDGQRLRFARALIATGARPAVPPIPGFAQAPYLTNETVFSLEERPQRLIVLGGGPIGCELAQAFRRLGSQVTLIDQLPRLLGRDDPEASALVQARFEREGVELRLERRVVEVETRGDAVAVRLEGPLGAETAEGDALLLAVGRKANVEELGLDAAGVEASPAGIVVDDHLRTTNKRIFGSGDVASTLQFTHAADALSRLVLRNALFPFGRGRASRLVMPWCTYTDPEVAHVGMTADEAGGDRNVQTLSVSLEALDRATLDGETAGFARVYADRGGRILGATMVSAHAGESIGEMAVAITAGLTLSDLAKTIHPYPTQAEAWKRLGDQWQRTRLTPGVAKLFGLWLRLQRR